MLACLAAAVLLGLLIVAIRLTSDSTMTFAIAFILCVSLGGLGGWAWQRWGREHIPLKSTPRMQPSKMFRQPSG